MGLAVRFNPVHPVTTIHTPAKAQEWGIDINRKWNERKWLYKLNTINEDNIEVYFMVNHTTIKDENDNIKTEKIPFEVYIDKLPGFTNIFKSEFHPSGFPNIEKYFNTLELFNHISMVNIRAISKSNKQYVIKSIIKSEIDKNFECEAYLVFTSVGIGLNKNTLKTYKILKYLKSFMR